MTRFLKTASKKVVYYSVEATLQFIGNKIAIKIVKPKPAIEENPKIVEETVIIPEKIK